MTIVDIHDMHFEFYVWEIDSFDCNARVFTHIN